MAMRIDGKKISAEIKEELKEQVARMKEDGISVCLAVIQVGNDPASSVYVGNKKKACAYIGIESRAYELPEETTEEQPAEETTEEQPAEETPEETTEEQPAEESTATAQNRETRFTESVRLRAEPSTEAEYLGTAYQGESVTQIESYDDGWSKINYNGTECYCMTQYLE